MSVRLLIVGGDGVTATSPCSSGGSGRVSVTESLRYRRTDPPRRERSIVGSLISTCTTNPAMNTQAP